MASLPIQFSDLLSNHGYKSGLNPIGRFAFMLERWDGHFTGLVVRAKNLFDGPEANSQSSCYPTRWVLRGDERTSEAFLIKVLLQLHDQLPCADVKGFSLAHIRPQQSTQVQAASIR
jgi:hypothetical protein